MAKLDVRAHPGLHLTPLVTALVPSILLLMAALAVFGVSLPNPFYFDDISILRDNPWLRQDSLPFSWLSGFYFDPLHLFPGYRPILMFSYWLNARIAGESSAALRAGNLLFHLLNAFLVARLVGRFPIKNARLVAWGSAFLFFLHPFQTLGINFLWKRSSLLEATFILSALVLHQRERERVSYRWPIIFAQTILFILALLTKESAVILPLLLLVLDFCLYRDRFRENRKSLFSLYGSLFVLSFVYIGFRLFALPKYILSERIFIGNRRWMSAGDYMLQQLNVIPTYLYDWLLPQPLLVHDPSPLTAFPWLGAGITALLLVLSTLVLRKRSSILSFSVAIFWIGLLPTVGPIALFLVRDPIRMYLGSIGLAVLTSFALAIETKRRLNVGLLIILIVGYGILSFRQNRRYADPRLIWGDVTRAYPKSGLAWEGLGAVLDETGEFANAAHAYDRAWKAEPDQPNYAVDYLLASQNAKEPVELQERVLKQIEFEKLDARRMLNLAIVEASLGQSGHAEKHFLQVIRENPDWGLAHLNLGILYERLGKSQQARLEYAQTLRLIPDHPFALAALKRLGGNSGN